VLIARDEARCITRCIASLKGVVDKVVVLDTGSRDATARAGRGSRRPGAPPALAG
jgi:glycosyltransferase involved in cell wall biosynthesis